VLYCARSSRGIGALEREGGSVLLFFILEGTRLTESVTMNQERHGDGFVQPLYKLRGGGAD